MAYIGKSPTGTGVRSRFFYTQSSAGATSISGNDDDNRTLTFSDAEYVDVYLNGSLLAKGDYTAASNTISGLAALASGDIVEVVVYDIFSVADTVSAKDGGTFSGNVGMQGLTATTGSFSGDLTVDTNTLKVDSTNNRLGIGTDSPASIAHALHATSPKLTLERDSTTLANNNVIGEIAMAHKDSNDAGTAVRIIGRAEGTAGAAGLAFNTGTPSSISEAMRIDASRNLLVGKTVEGANNIGFQARPDGFFSGTRNGGTVAYLQRQTSDGEILRFQKDSSTVGSIGVSAIGTSPDFYAGNSGGSGLFFGGGRISPMHQLVRSDNNIDLGHPSFRFDDIYATNGTIQTSDQNEKQQIASLTTAEITAAKAISKLFKTFKWTGKVEAKGDAARTHVGVIAQEVQTAMTDAGLNAAHYAFWCSDTWWEADETYTDDDDVEQTRTNTYYTAEEAPEGATQHTRLGIRYPELLAFIGAATEQRLADIETRLNALEAAE